MLSRLDAPRKGTVVQFLHNADLIKKCQPIVALSGADLQGIRLATTNLHNADLRDADLRDASLNSTNLSYADLRGTDLRGADLRNADLRGANLAGATGISNAELEQQSSFLAGAIMPDETSHN